jgi:hypothetical protein
MDGLRFNDLLHGVPVSIGIGYGYLGFVSSLDDIEVWFTPTDCQTIAHLLERTLSKATAGQTASHEFDNHGDEGTERACFSVREQPSGIEMTLASGLKDDESKTQPNASTMSICISTENAKMLADALNEQLVNLRNSLPAE